MPKESLYKVLDYLDKQIDGKMSGVTTDCSELLYKLQEAVKKIDRALDHVQETPTTDQDLYELQEALKRVSGLEDELHTLQTRVSIALILKNTLTRVEEIGA